MDEAESYVSALPRRLAPFTGIFCASFALCISFALAASFLSHFKELVFVRLCRLGRPSRDGRACLLPAFGFSLGGKIVGLSGAFLRLYSAAEAYGIKGDASVVLEARSGLQTPASFCGIQERERKPCE